MVGEISRMNPRFLLTAGALAAAVGVSVFVGGGFEPLSRAIFVASAGAAVLCAVVLDGATVRRAVGTPAVVSLLILAALSALSAIWTVGNPVDALRWSLVIGAYAGTACAGAAVARRPTGIRAIVAPVCVLAALTAAIGLVATALRSDPLALRIGGTWRPAGPFEYPPALALLQVAALPGLVFGMVRGRLPIAIIAAVGAAVAASVLALADSRLELALASAVLLATAVAPGAETEWPLRLGAIALLALSGLGAYLLLGGDRARADEFAGDGHRLFRLALIPIVVAVLWPGFRSWLAKTGAPQAARRAARLAVLVMAILVAAGAVAAASFDEPSKGRAVEGQSGFDHGRVVYWRAAIETMAHRPLNGGGADAFLSASQPRQGASPVLYAHNLPLEVGAELGVLGFLIVTGLYWATGLAIWHARREPAAWLVAPGVAAFLVANLADWPWHLAGAGAVWGLLLGGLIGINAPRIARPPVKSPPQSPSGSHRPVRPQQCRG